jgi:hypothetical protein
MFLLFSRRTLDYQLLGRGIILRRYRLKINWEKKFSMQAAF